MPHPRFPRSLLRLALLAGLGLAGPAGCDKPNDQPALQQEVLATAKSYDHRLDELADRADELDRRRQAVPHDTLDAAAAEHDLGQARAAIEDRRSYLRGVRARIAGRPGSVLELHALLDEMRARLEGGLVEATAELGAVDSWLASAARLPRAGAQPAADPARQGQDPGPEPGPGSEAEDDAPQTDRTGAPIR